MAAAKVTSKPKWGALDPAPVAAAPATSSSPHVIGVGGAPAVGAAAVSTAGAPAVGQATVSTAPPTSASPAPSSARAKGLAKVKPTWGALDTPLPADWKDRRAAFQASKVEAQKAHAKRLADDKAAKAATAATAHATPPALPSIAEPGATVVTEADLVTSAPPTPASSSSGSSPSASTAPASTPPASSSSSSSEDASSDGEALRPTLLEEAQSFVEAIESFEAGIMAQENDEATTESYLVAVMSLRDRLNEVLELAAHAAHAG